MTSNTTKAVLVGGLIAVGIAAYLLFRKASPTSAPNYGQVNFTQLGSNNVPLESNIVTESQSLVANPAMNANQVLNPLYPNNLYEQTGLLVLSKISFGKLP